MENSTTTRMTVASSECINAAMSAYIMTKNSGKRPTLSEFRKVKEELLAALAMWELVQPDHREGV